MDRTALVSKTEAYVKEVMSRQAPIVAVAHDFKHVDRVRNWALVFGKEEGYPDLVVLELTSLLHDIGLGHITGEEASRAHVVLPPHGPLGAEMAAQFLKENSGLDAGMIEIIADAISHHSDPPFSIGQHHESLLDKGALSKILRDADAADAMGAAGLMRAFTSKAFLPEYDPENVKGPAWGLSSIECAKLFGGRPPVKTIADQINQQIRYCEGLHTKTAQRLCSPLVDFMRRFMLQLEAEAAAKVKT
jgi:HD superfamily phosphodiesterase